MNTFPVQNGRSNLIPGVKTMKRYPSIICMLALLCIGSVSGYALAVTATLLGLVTDSSGALVPNAQVIITEIATGVSHAGKSNESGNYIFPNVQPGRYTVSVEAAGFKKEVRHDITVLVDSAARIDVQLQPGSVSESVVVTAAPPLLQTDNSSTAQKIQTAVVENSPLSVNRNFETLLNLVPGASPAVFDHSQFYNAEGSLQTEVNGQMRFGNNYMIEGTDDNTRAGNLQIYIPPRRFRRLTCQQVIKMRNWGARPERW